MRETKCEMQSDSWGRISRTASIGDVQPTPAPGWALREDPLSHMNDPKNSRCCEFINSVEFMWLQSKRIYNIRRD